MQHEPAVEFPKHPPPQQALFASGGEPPGVHGSNSGMQLGVAVGVSVGVLVAVGVSVGVLVGVFVGVGVLVAHTFAAQTSVAAQHLPPTPPQRPALVPPGPQSQYGPVRCAA